MAGEFDGVGFVAGRVDDFEAEFGADGAADELNAVVRSFADGRLAVYFLNEKTIGEAGIEGGSFREDFGDLEQLSVLVDAKGSANTGELKDHSSAALCVEGLTLEDGPADG